MLTTLLAAAPLLAPAVQGGPYVRTVLQSQDTLSNGATLIGLVDTTIADSGSWAALVAVSGGRAVVRDGVVVLATGDVYFGDPVVGIEQIELSRDGVLGVLYSTPGSGPAPATRLRIGPDLVLATGDPISYGFGGISGLVQAIDRFDFEGDAAVVNLVYTSFIGVNERALVAGSIAGGGFSPFAGWKEGGVIAGFGARFEDFEDCLSAAPASRFAAAIEVESAGPDAHGIVANGAGSIESGDPVPGANATWSFLEPPRLELSAGDETVIAGTIRTSSGAHRGVVHLGGQEVAREGDTVNGVPGDPVAPFDTAAVQIQDDGTPIFLLPFQSGRERLMADSEVIVETGTQVDPGTLSSGEVIVSLLWESQGGRLDATSDGDTIIVAGTTFSGLSVFLIEREIGSGVSCAAVPNSTGAFGRLRAEGSSYVAANDLTLVASELPPDQFALLVASMGQQFVPNPGGSEGNLCIGPTIGRFNGQVQSSGAAGEVTFGVDLAMIPQPSALVAGAPGDTWYFQAWHRDVVGGAQTSNYTRARSVTLR